MLELEKTLKADQIKVKAARLRPEEATKACGARGCEYEADTEKLKRVEKRLITEPRRLKIKEEEVDELRESLEAEEQRCRRKSKEEK